MGAGANLPRARRAATVRGSGAGADWSPVAPSRRCGGVRAWVSTAKERIDLKGARAGADLPRARRAATVRDFGAGADWSPVAPSRRCGVVRAWVSTAKERIDLTVGQPDRDGSACREEGIQDLRGGAGRWLVVVRGQPGVRPAAATAASAERKG